jgi:hypothetical protein
MDLSFISVLVYVITKDREDEDVTKMLHVLISYWSIVNVVAQCCMCFSLIIKSCSSILFLNLVPQSCSSILHALISKRCAEPLKHYKTHTLCYCLSLKYCMCLSYIQLVNVIAKMLHVLLLVNLACA